MEFSVFFFSNLTKKTNSYIPNLLAEKKVSYLKIHTDKPDFPYGKGKTNYIFYHAKKLLSFDYKDNSVIDNSYIILLKLKIEKIYGIDPEFILYGRYRNSLNPINDPFIPDKINYFLSFYNSIKEIEGTLTLRSKLDVDLLNIDSQEFDFDGISPFIFYLRIENGIDYDNINAKKNRIIMGFISDNHYFKISYPNLDSLAFDDKHVFGFSTKKTSSIFYFYLYEYIISKGRDFFYDDVNEEIILEKDCNIKKNPFMQKRLLSDSKTLILNSTDNMITDYCGITLCKM